MHVAGSQNVLLLLLISTHIVVWRRDTLYVINEIPTKWLSIGRQARQWKGSSGVAQLNSNFKAGSWSWGQVSFKISKYLSLSLKQTVSILQRKEERKNKMVKYVRHIHLFHLELKVWFIVGWCDHVIWLFPFPRFLYTYAF